MKKIRVFELAKAKKITNEKAFELLKKKGFSKVSAITYVVPTVLDDLLAAQQSSVVKVSPLFKNPRAATTHRAPSGARAASALAASAPPPAPVRQKTRQKAASTVAQKPSEKVKQSVAQKEDRPDPAKTHSNVLPAMSMAFGIVALIACGFLYTEMVSGTKEIRQISADVGRVESTVQKVDQVTVGHKAQLLDMQQELNGVSGQVTDVRKVVDGVQTEVGATQEQLQGIQQEVGAFRKKALAIQLKSQGAVLGALATNLDEPLRTNTESLARQLSEF